MPQQATDEFKCPACGQPVEPGDAECAACAESLDRQEQNKDEPVDAIVQPRSGSLSAMIHNRWFVLGTLFLVALFLGLPMLWGSRAFSLTGKIFFTVATLIWTAIVFAGFAAVMWWCYTRIAESMT